MPDQLATYINDHLGGAEFAISLLNDLRDQSADKRIAIFAAEILPEIEADREALQGFSKEHGQGHNVVKETAAWLVQKMSRIKLSPDDQLGAFEALETLCLGIQGKMALWNALAAVKPFDARLSTLDLEVLTARAQEQHTRAEKLRLQIAPSALGADAD